MTTVYSRLKTLAILAVAASVALIGCPPPGGVTAPDVVGMTQEDAEAAITGAGLTVGTVTESNSETVPAGSVISQTPAAGTSVAENSAVDLEVSLGAVVTVTGTVLFDDGSAVQGASVTGSAGVEELAAALRLALEREAELADYNRPGAKENPGAITNLPEILERFMVPEKQQSVVTDMNGDFTFEVVASALPARILAEVSYASESMPTIDSARWEPAASGDLDMGTITIPNPQGAQVTITDGAGQNDDGSVRVENLPEEVDTLFTRSYDPDETPEAFPGDFTEMGNIPLNSSLFLWMEALDAEGNPVDDLSQAATIRSRIPESQWIDLEDIDDGTDRIELPIYNFNETIDMWEQMGIGWLEDGSGTVLPEDAQSVILDGTFSGELFATFTTDHFSWMNVDYAYIGPWTLSRLDRANRNNDCLYNALQLASRIAKSAAGHAAYARVNQEDANLDDELGDAMGPELKNNDLEGAYGVYKGDAGGSETQFEIDNDIWDGCGEGATEEQKKNTTLIMAVTILHETAHWKDDVKKHPDHTDTAGEEGNQLEQDLFGGIITGNADGIRRDGSALDNATRDTWLDHANWPPAGSKAVQLAAAQKQDPSLAVTIALPSDTFELGEEMPVEVTYENVSSSPISVLNSVQLEGWPLYFNIIPQGGDTRVRFLGPEFKLNLTDSDYTTLDPGATLVQTVNLLRDPGTGSPHYQLLNSGTYDIQAVYEGNFGVAEATSNTLTVSVLTGGSISGTVANATDNNPLAGATVRVLQNDFVLTTTTTDALGMYTIPELPADTYTIEVQASGFLRGTRENVQVSAGANTDVNLNLSPLLAQGQLRMVLRWNEEPRDLDSHLWLPMEYPYHIYYLNDGDLESCPYASLDTDEQDSYGPETITISQRFNQGTYAYAVHKYAGQLELNESEAQVQVFDATGLIATFEVPTEGEGLWWHVLNIDGATGAITEVNTIVSDSPEPYEVNTGACDETPAAR